MGLVNTTYFHTASTVDYLRTMKITGSVIFGSVAFFVGLLMCYEFTQWWLSHKQCLPAPYLYLTFHSNLNGVRCVLSLLSSPSLVSELNEMIG